MIMAAGIGAPIIIGLSTSVAAVSKPFDPEIWLETIVQDIGA
jgi:hypothetical protein